MSEFQLSLIIAAAVFVIVIFIYNKWQEYRARKSVDLAFNAGQGADQDDVLMNPMEHTSPLFRNDVQRQEPSLDGASFSTTTEAHYASNPDVGADADANADADVKDHANAASMPAIKIEKELPVDELIDCIIPLEFEHPIRGEKLLAEVAHLKVVGKKQVHFAGMLVSGERDMLAHGGAYTCLFAGIQMVSRSGPLNELEFSEFVSQLREIADRLNAHSDVPDMNVVMAQARELHQFMSEHDAQLSLSVISNGPPWSVETLLASLEKTGFDVRSDGRLVMPDGDGGNLFTLSTNVSVSETQTSKLTLLLDVPCVAPSLDGFGSMSSCARVLASRLSGTVVDDGHHPIPKEALDEIAEQVSDFYNGMQEAQIPAGSRRAKRLFS
jgi:FtsZ-interacting cell division protein ZipA